MQEGEHNHDDEFSKGRYSPRLRGKKGGRGLTIRASGEEHENHHNLAERGRRWNPIEREKERKGRPRSIICGKGGGLNSQV